MISNITKKCLFQSNSGIRVLVSISGGDMAQCTLLSTCLSPRCRWLVTVGIWGALSVNPEHTQTLSAVIPEHVMWFLTLAFWKQSTALGCSCAAAVPVLGWAALWARLPPQQNYLGICWWLLHVLIAGCSCWQGTSPSALSQCKPVCETWAASRSICSHPSLPICHHALCFP